MKNETGWKHIIDHGMPGRKKYHITWLTQKDDLWEALYARSHGKRIVRNPPMITWWILLALTFGALGINVYLILERLL